MIEMNRLKFVESFSKGWPKKKKKKKNPAIMMMGFVSSKPVGMKFN